MDEKTEKQIKKEVNTQISWIALYGCRKIRCKKCYLKTVCPHVPQYASTIALELIRASRGEKNDN